MTAPAEHEEAPGAEILPTATGTVLTGASPIDIGNGQTAPLGELLANRHKRCPHCSEGWVRRIHPGGPVVSAVCGCCVAGYQRKRAAIAAAAITPAIAVPIASVTEMARARRRVDRLVGIVVALEAERDRRKQRFDELNAELIDAARSAAATAQDESVLALKAEADVQWLEAGVAEAERKLELQRMALGGAESALRAHREARVLALAMQSDAEREIERRRDRLKLAALDKDIAKARRRLTGARIYTGVGDEAATGVGNNPGPGGQP